MISKRLLEITKYITDNTTLIDVGCDHALLDIYVFLNKKNLKIIAVDINKNAIRKALKNAKKYDVLNKIDIKINDGLKNLNLNVDTLIFSGLGGIKIRKLLINNNLNNIKKIIIQPNNNDYEIRKYLVKNEFYIKNESTIFDHKQIYTTIVFEKGFKKYKLKELYFGPILLKKKDDLLKLKLDKEINEFKNIVTLLPKNKFIKKIKLKIKILIFQKIKKTF